VTRAEVFCGGCLVVEGASFKDDPDLATRLAREQVFADWQIVVIHDDAPVARSAPDFLWATWTRFEPASDLYAAATTVERHHLAYRAPIVIDARMKPGYPDELIVRPDIAELVDRRWGEYFPKG
jgi:3-polyprenyl-4-hydroxybenzoate decarboxylase